VEGEGQQYSLGKMATHATSRSTDNLTKAKAAMLAQNKDGEIHCRVMDLDNEKETKVTLAKIVSEFGAIDFLVANSASFGVSTVGELIREDWNRALTAKWWSLFWLVEAVVPLMRKNNAGVILNVGSIYSKEPQCPAAGKRIFEIAVR
jgi:NADP-dependent 3-hydroxy acid dehydrogenase YdfG